MAVLQRLSGCLAQTLRLSSRQSAALQQGAALHLSATLEARRRAGPASSDSDSDEEGAGGNPKAGRAGAAKRRALADDPADRVPTRPPGEPWGAATACRRRRLAESPAHLRFSPGCFTPLSRNQALQPCCSIQCTIHLAAAAPPSLPVAFGCCLPTALGAAPSLFLPNMQSCRLRSSCTRRWR